ncbi:hypothetical protein [Streptomyces jumonjinensis]|uniref:Uncharacterized protein n=1 Tax=Streptomyces jumonjinensis TaxID=1945 RepID=A0A646KLK1_STRJU|nr:hypothetical protein [Streptomyces jumonjinensis]MQT02907.1 hypothetical protein [Streptomyces jumonjinensis]
MTVLRDPYAPRPVGWPLVPVEPAEGWTVLPPVPASNVAPVIPIGVPGPSAAAEPPRPLPVDDLVALAAALNVPGDVTYMDIRAAVAV